MFEIEQAVEFFDPIGRRWIPGNIVDVEDGVYEVEKTTGKVRTGIPENKIRVPTKVVKKLAKKADGKRIPKKVKEKIADGMITDDKMAKKKRIATAKSPTGEILVGTGKVDEQAGTNSLSGQLHDDFQFAFNWFNDHLFEGKLAKPFWVTIRKRNVLAHFSAKRWASRTENSGNEPVVVDEMGINPDYMLLRDVEDFLSSIVHEMMHQWQEYYGEDKPRTNYHNKEWSDAMEAIGLIPSSTGAEGGRKTGQKMDHYIVDGKFRDACKVLLANGYALRWAGAIEEFHGAGIAYVPAVFALPSVGVKPQPVAKKTHRQKFTCGKCKANAWAKPTANLWCGDCKKVMEPS